MACLLNCVHSGIIHRLLTRSAVHYRPLLSLMARAPFALETQKSPMSLFIASLYSVAMCLDSSVSKLSAVSLS